MSEMKKSKNISKFDLYEFAYCGSEEAFNKKIKALSKIAEEEKWGFSDKEPYKILRTYIFKTFERCNRQKKIIYSSDNKWCCANTGLLTPNSKDILMMFEENKNKEKSQWIFKYFKTSADREYMRHFNCVPKLATYTENYEDYYFKSNKDIEINTDHILDDNWQRINNEVKLPKPIVKGLLSGAVDEAKIKAQRNMRLAVPQYYNGKIMYLLPIRFPVNDNEYITMALAVEETEQGQYRANTIFTKEMAYEKARLLMKPESNWLID